MNSKTLLLGASAAGLIALAAGIPMLTKSDSDSTRSTKVSAYANTRHTAATTPDASDQGLEHSTPGTKHTEARILTSTTPDSSPQVIEESFSYQPLDPGGELIEPLPLDVEEMFEDYLEIDYEPEQIELGRLLFHDTRLSADNTLSCASCHDLRYGGIDRAVTATGVNGAIGPINTPTVFNSGFNNKQFWDGRAADLEAQADGPPNAAGEMASNWDEITSKLIQDSALMAQLHAAYPDEDFSNGVDPMIWQQAIAYFERSLATPNAPFDQYLMGDDEAISEMAKEGYQIFKDIGCIECHNGLSIGGSSFQRLGRKREFFTQSAEGIHLGRFNVTGDSADRGVFKVANLRNIALTAPYLHDGSEATLAGVVDVMAEFQLDIELTDAQNERLVEFLTSLTGEYEGRSLGAIQNTIDFQKEGHQR